MTRIGRVFFVSFYIWATIAVAGEKSTRTVKRFLHPVNVGVDVNAFGLMSLNDLPSFSHAKKRTLNDVVVSPALSSLPEPIIRALEVPAPGIEYSPATFKQDHASRAPPVLI